MEASDVLNNASLMALAAAAAESSGCRVRDACVLEVEPAFPSESAADRSVLG